MTLGLLQGKVAVVTGGSQGIGYACAAELASQGAQVLLIARTQPALERAAERVAHDCAFVPADVSDATAVARAIHEVVQRFGTVDVLVNAHGILPPAVDFPDVPAKVWDDLLGVNLRGLINTGQAAARIMRDRRCGVIVNVSSVNALLAEPTMSPYNVAKGALAALTRSMAYDLGKHGVRVVGVEPGWVRTPMSEEYLAPLAGEWLECSMLGRFGEPAEIASVVGFLAGPGASYITGTMVTVDGGHSAILPALRVAEGVKAVTE